MEFEFSREEKEFIQQLRSFIKREAIPELVEETHKLESIYGGIEGSKFLKNSLPTAG